MLGPVGMAGRSMYRATAIFKNGNSTLNVSELVPGIYVLKLTGENGKGFYIKFVTE
jgi:hypothetical protein